jgi:hypothetical protein
VISVSLPRKVFDEFHRFEGAVRGTFLQKPLKSSRFRPCLEFLHCARAFEAPTVDVSHRLAHSCEGSVALPAADLALPLQLSRT